MGTAPTHRNRGIAKALLGLLFKEGRKLGCGSAWVQTERSNIPAVRLYQSFGGTEATEDIVMYSLS
jgi:ribosomal-protein-alanine N-acetyltransferase